MAEHAKFELRVDFLNVSCTPVNNYATTSATSSNFGRRTSISQGNDPRQVQIALRFSFSFIRPSRRALPCTVSVLLDNRPYGSGAGAGSQIKWKTGKDPLFNKGGAILVDGLLLATDGNKLLYLIEPDPSGFKPLAKAELLESGENWAPLAPVHRKLLIRDDKKMKCVMVAQ